MVADPKATPVTCGWVAGVVAPCAMKTLVGFTVTFVVSPLDRVMVTPFTGAPFGKLTANGTD